MPQTADGVLRRLFPRKLSPVHCQAGKATVFLIIPNDSAAHNTIPGNLATVEYLVRDFQGRLVNKKTDLPTGEFKVRKP